MLSEEMMEKFIKGEVVFHCPTQESWDLLMNKSTGKANGILSSEDWKICKNRSCVEHSITEGMLYADVDYYTSIEEKHIVTIECTTSPQQDLEALRSLLLKYKVCIVGNLERVIEAKVHGGKQMMNQELLKRFKDGQVVFHCPTHEVYKKLMIELEKHGCLWRDKRVPTDKDEWGCYEDRTCIECGEDEALTFGPIAVYGNAITLTLDDFKAPPEPIAPSSVDYPQPPQELISILRALATCVLIEKTHGVHLNLDELYDKREEYLEKWTSEFEVHF